MASGYQGSRHSEIEAMLAGVETGECERGPGFPTVTAGASETVGDDLGRVAAGEVAVGADLDGFDLDAMEHKRQNRLTRWQTPPLTSRIEVQTWRT